jgi:hypothetical protein
MRGALVYPPPPGSSWGPRYRDGSERGLEGGGHAHARISTPAVRRGSVALANLHITPRRIECEQVPRLLSAFARLCIISVLWSDPSTHRSPR